jgi:hypothetical protein
MHSRHYNGTTGTLLGPSLTLPRPTVGGNYMYQTNQGPSYPPINSVASGAVQRSPGWGTVFPGNGVAFEEFAHCWGFVTAENADWLG